MGRNISYSTNTSIAKQTLSLSLSLLFYKYNRATSSLSLSLLFYKYNRATSSLSLSLAKIEEYRLFYICNCTQ